MPAHDFYVEPFFGSGQVFWRKRPADRNVIIDADSGMVDRFRADCRRSSPKIALVDRFADPRAGSDAAGLVSAARAICGDAISILPTLTLPADAVVYCDPPYLLSTRTSRHRYKFEMTDDQHALLLARLQDLKCRVMISGYPSDLYAKRLKSWRCISYRTRTRGRTLTECLWLNFPEPTDLHDWRFAGRNFRERLALNRQAARWLARLDGMPPVKRGFLLNAVHQRHFSR